MKISIVVATSINNVIGKNNELLWKLPGDLIYFQKLTTGHHIVMGKKTWRSIPEDKKPLSERTNIVLTRDKNYSVPEGVFLFDNFGDAVEFAKTRQEEELMVIGGEQVYRVALPIADKIYMTLVKQEFEGDAFFPEIDMAEWKIVSSKDVNKEGQVPYSRNVMERR